MPDMPLPPGIITADTITKPGPETRGRVMVSGSHGGVYPAWLAIRTGLRAVLLNDASVGKDRAGIGCLDYCRQRGMATASARIGEAESTWRDGMLSAVNRMAQRAGLAVGQSCMDAVTLLSG